MANEAVRFSLGTLVYRITDPEEVGMITGIVFRSNGHTYRVTFGGDSCEADCYEIELTDEKRFETGPGGLKDRDED